MSSVQYVGLKNNLRTSKLESEIYNIIKEKIEELPNIHTLKLDVELTLLCCDLIENYVADKKLETDKKTLVIKVLSEIFSLTEEEQNQIGNTIEFLFNNNKISRIKFFSVIAKSGYSWFKKKFL